jgi:hypothetical protein
MNTRIAPAVLIALSLGTFAAPASAQAAQTFNAWGHEFIVPGSQSSAVAASAVRDSDGLATGSITAPRAYTSAKVGDAFNAGFDARPQSARTINVWGARIDAPAY